jgi:hypothetical protein
MLWKMLTPTTMMLRIAFQRALVALEDHLTVCERRRSRFQEIRHWICSFEALAVDAALLQTWCKQPSRYELRSVRLK